MLDQRFLLIYFRKKKMLQDTLMVGSMVVMNENIFMHQLCVICFILYFLKVVVVILVSSV